MSQEPPGPRTQASRRFWGREWDESVFLTQPRFQGMERREALGKRLGTLPFVPRCTDIYGLHRYVQPYGYGFQAAWSGIGYRNQRVWVDLGITFQETDQVVEDFTVPP